MRSTWLSRRFFFSALERQLERGKLGNRPLEEKFSLASLLSQCLSAADTSLLALWHSRSWPETNSKPRAIESRS